MTPAGFLALLAIATMLGGNVVAARLALDNGVDIFTVVAVRSLVTAAAVALLVAVQRVPMSMNARQRRVMPLICLLVGVQSLALYAAVARLPVSLAVLSFNTYPMWTALFAWLIYGRAPERAVLMAMPVILLGLCLALDVGGVKTGLAVGAQRGDFRLGIVLALAAAAAFGGMLVLTQHEVAQVDGRYRTAIVMSAVGALALIVELARGGLHWPQAAPGWWGLAALCILYGAAFTALFTLLPRLGVVGNSPILNLEPVAAVLLAWWVLHQRMASIQLAGVFLVVAAVLALGFRVQIAALRIRRGSPRSPVY